MMEPDPDDPNYVAPGDVDHLRDRLAAMVALRLAPVEAPPLSSLRGVPPFALGICADLVDEFRAKCPDGLPPTNPHLVVKEFTREARRRFDLELSRQYRLDSPHQADIGL